MCVCVSLAVAKSAATVPSNRSNVAVPWYSNVKLSAAYRTTGVRTRRGGLVSQGETEKLTELMQLSNTCYDVIHCLFD